MFLCKSNKRGGYGHPELKMRILRFYSFLLNLICKLQGHEELCLWDLMLELLLVPILLISSLQKRSKKIQTEVEFTTFYSRYKLQFDLCQLQHNVSKCLVKL